ncbi:hypothetical protein [Rhodococcus qingshengii]|uniref:hypothetical protein n=1 Tax=Rhodococcus qingshengii TaxID=334542 RepID=UPI001C5D1E8D|nr:hypothetical protein [Rhodococcus qingshengii]MBW4814611.1 hypothetical protein [Rhodococcus qingshengii]
MSKLTVDINEETALFIKSIAHELSTQNNRHTDTPIFRIYEEQKVERRDGCGDHTERLDYEGAHEYWCEPCKRIWEEFDCHDDRLPALGEDDCYCDGLADAHWTYDIELLPAVGGYDGVAFLTEKAAQEYLESNSYHFTKGVVYAESAFRNHELKPIIAALQEIGSQL